MLYAEYKSCTSASCMANPWPPAPNSGITERMIPATVSLSEGAIFLIIAVMKLLPRYRFHRLTKIPEDLIFMFVVMVPDYPVAINNRPKNGRSIRGVQKGRQQMFNAGGTQQRTVSMIDYCIERISNLKKI